MKNGKGSALAPWPLVIKKERRQLKAPEEAQKWIMEATGKISEWEDALVKYCNSTGRIPRSRELVAFYTSSIK
jgi:hypothetical protein